VAPLPVLLEYCLPLARVGGRFLAYKGPDAPQEIQQSAKALETLGGRVTRLHQLALPQAMGERVLVLVEKTGATPDHYPRRAGLPAKRPL
jgi:16S rRNA (guanine527-N7)-methyltransferase